MAKMAEKKMMSIQNEVDKLRTRIQKKENHIKKNLAKCEKLGCAEWTEEEFAEKRKTLSEKSFKKGLLYMEFDESLTEKQNSLLYDRFYSYPNEMEDLKRRLENAEERLAKATERAFEVNLKIDEENAIEQKEKSWISAIQKSETEYEAWLKQFKAECLLDGITIEYVTNALIAGKTKSGKQFTMYLNSGYTYRSNHCYTLTIESETIFTSGLFSTGYSIIKR